MDQAEKWYKNPIAITALIIFVFPLGVFLMWKYTRWNIGIKLLVTGFFFFIFIVGASNDKSKTTQVVPSPTPEISIPTPTIPVIDYQIYKKWSIPNGGEGKVIIISPQNFNASDMALLGLRLNSDTSSDRNAFIFVFTDRKAAVMRDRVLNEGVDKLTSSEQDFYDEHYVAQYTKNGNSNINEFTIYYDGVMGADRDTIKF